jgi:hypothetical protein
MQSSYGPAITHVQSGMKILCEVQYSGQQPQHSVLEASAVPYVPMPMLEELFMRLDLQVTQVRPPALVRNSSDGVDGWLREQVANVRRYEEICMEARNSTCLFKFK